MAGQEDQIPCMHGCKVEEQLEKILHELERLNAAFPEDRHGNPDAIGHREFHERRISAASAEEKFWQDLKLDLAKKGALALLTVIIGLIVTGAAVKLGFVGGR